MGSLFRMLVDLVSVLLAVFILLVLVTTKYLCSKNEYNRIIVAHRIDFLLRSSLVLKNKIITDQ